MTTVFTASSHHPFKIPEKYNGKFKKGKIQMHEPIQYTDYAIKKYFETAKKQPWFNNTIFVLQEIIPTKFIIPNTIKQ
jgi:phosphoglycerol transferase MdoB-like AlkP superfamily enzyme